jgi:glycosyltransferase involved in cell wall biosynthesis
MLSGAVHTHVLASGRKPSDSNADLAPRNVRVLFHLSNSFSEAQVIGGAELGMLVVMKALRSIGFEPHVLMHGGGYFEKLLTQSGIPYEIRGLASNASGLSRNKRIGVRDALVATTETIRTASGISRAVNNWKIDVIHANHLSGYLSCGLAARWNRIPNVWHLHEGLERGFVSHILEKAARILADHLITMAPYEASTIARMTRQLGHTMIESAFAFDELLASPRRDRDELRNEFGVGPQDVLIAYVSHLAPYKGQGTFVKAFAQLPRNASPRYRAVIVGGPRKSFEWFPDQLRTEVTSLGLQDRVQFCGYRSDVPDIMRAADIFVCVSESEEFNRVLVEAMAFGKPVIATDLRGGSIVIANGETGLLVKPRDVASLKDALWSLRNGETRMRLGDNGHKYVLDRFSIGKLVLKYQNVYLSLLKPTSARQA